MKALNSVIGWTRDQWTAALQFYDKPCINLEDYLACRIYWWAHWDNPPAGAQLFFIDARPAHHAMTTRLFQQLAPNLNVRHLDTE